MWTYQDALRAIRNAKLDGKKELNLSNLPPGCTSFRLGEQKSESFVSDIVDDLKTTYWRFFKNRRMGALPPEIGDLANLTSLNVSENALGEIPSEIGRLSNLINLNLAHNALKSLPSTFNRLVNLQSLNLQENRFTALPLEILQLTNLQFLSLHVNPLKSLPPEFVDMKRLEGLDFGNIQLDSLPLEITKLTNLRKLSLFGCRFKSLPPEIGDLTNLVALDLEHNQLESLPPEMGRMTNLEELRLGYNPLKSPPPEIVAQGLKAILSYLQAQLAGGRKQWRAKLVVVGEGGAGKTSLLRRLRGEPFSPTESTTHGVANLPIKLSHPTQHNTLMELNAWDFGGQEIYHATHQFFLTDRALFLLVWNARQGWQQSRLEYWLDMIHARAPEAPVLLIATHIDERRPDLGDAFHKSHPQILASCGVSNLSGQGLSDLEELMRTAAAGLPLMGEFWPDAWLNAAEAAARRPETYITAREMIDHLAKHGVTGEGTRTLLQWLHERGDVIHFRDDRDLNGLALLKPHWASQLISRVLDSDEIKKSGGLFTRQDMDTLWGDTESVVRDHLLRLMEKFDLAYSTESDRREYLVVESFPSVIPAYESTWESVKANPCDQMAVRFRLNSLPAGIPTWFIAREHRFTMNMHWRHGALLADGSPWRHLGLIQAKDQSVQLTVRGPYPQNFFALLRDGLEVTLSRYPGLQVDCLVPCLGHGGKPCRHEFDYGFLQRCIEASPPRETVQCQITGEEVSVSRLLFGWDRTPRQNAASPDEPRPGPDSHARIEEQLRNNNALLQRGFADLFKRDQARIESQCPNVFVLRPIGSKHWIKDVFAERMELILFCAQPGCWHAVENGGRYEIIQPAKWITSLAPHIRHLCWILKHAVRMVGPSITGEAAKYADTFQKYVETMEALVQQLPQEEQSALPPTKSAAPAEGATLRAMRQLLDAVDAAQHWGGLRQVLTPEHHYLWLCEHHAQSYAS
jgi:GTPase SAR1 family protein